MAQIGYFIAGQNAVGIVLNDAGTIAYMAEYGDGIGVFDVANPRAPRRLFNIGVGDGPFYRITRSGDLIAATAGLTSPTVRVYRISASPLTTVALTQVAVLPGATDVWLNGTMLYASGGDRVTIYDVTVLPTLNGGLPPVLATMISGIAVRNGIAGNGTVALVGGASVRVRLLDVSNPYLPRFLSEIAATSVDGKLLGNYAYLATGSTGLKVANIANTSSPSLSNYILDSNGTPFPAHGAVLHRTPDGKNWLLVASNVRGLKILDLSKPDAPSIAATFDTPGSAKDVDVSSDGRYAYVTDFGSGLQIFDITTITSPRLVSTFARPNDGPAEYVTAMTIFDGINTKQLALVAWGSGSPHTKIIDVTDPGVPRQIITLPVFTRMDVFGNYALAPISSFGLQFYDLVNPAAPIQGQRVNTPGPVRSVYVIGDKAYVADDAAVVDVVDIVGNN